jgi:hypothetical protein
VHNAIAYHSQPPLAVMDSLFCRAFPPSDGAETPQTGQRLFNYLQNGLFCRELSLGGDRLETLRLLEFLVGSLEVAFGFPRSAPVIEGGGIVRLQLDRLAVILDRSLVVLGQYEK